MVSQFARIGICAVAAVAFSAGAAMAEKIKNPEYESWSKFKAGAMSKVEGVTVAAGNESKQTIITKLVSITPEKAVVETTMAMEVMGNKMDLPAQKREVAAEIEKPAAIAGTPDAKAPEIKTSDENVTIAGKEVKCKVSETTTEQSGMKVTAKAWNSSDVPGGLVKMESKSTGAMEATTKMTLVEFTTGG